MNSGPIKLKIGANIKIRSKVKAPPTYVIPDKKKQKSKNLCRQKIIHINKHEPI